MWEIYLQQIREEKELYDEEINSGASEKEIYELVTTAKEKWNMEIPQQYLDVLSRVLISDNRKSKTTGNCLRH